MIYLTLFLEFFRIGLFCFGGAFGMIPIIRDAVLSHAWMTEPDFYGFIGICESTPGPIAVNIATYIGYTQGGIPGSVLAVLGVVLPSFIIILIIASILNNFNENKYVKAFMTGVRPVVAALIIQTGISFLINISGITSSFSTPDYFSVILFLLITGIYLFVRYILKKNISSVGIILISAVLGIVAGVSGEMFLN